MGERLGKIIPISASEAVLCTLPATWMVCTGLHLHLQGTAACLNPWGPPLTQPAPSGAGQHLSYLTLSVLFHLLGCTAPSSLREYLSFTLGRSCLQRLSSCALPSPLAKAQVPGQVPFLGLHLLPWRGCSTQHCSSWVTRGSPPWQLKPLHISADWR